MSFGNPYAEQSQEVSRIRAQSKLSGEPVFTSTQAKENIDKLLSQRDGPQVAATRPRDSYFSRDISFQRRFGINRAGERLTRLAETAPNGNETVFAFDGDHKKSCFAAGHLATEGHLFASAAEALDAFAEWAAQRGRLGVPVRALKDGERYALIEYRARPAMIEWVPTTVSDF